MTALSTVAPMPRAAAIVRTFGHVIDWATISFGAALVILIFANVLLHLVGHDLAWTTELGELMMVWVTFLGGAAAAQRHEHVAITELVDLLGLNGRRWADGLAQLVSAAVLGLLIGYGLLIADAGLSNRLTAIDLPMAWEYLALPVGSAATLVFVVWDLVQIAAGHTRAQRYGV